MRLSHFFLPGLLVAAACVPTPIQPAAPRTGTPTTASFDKAWKAAIDIFSERNIPIKTLDRSSGLIVAENQTVPATADGLADCGKVLGTALRPTAAAWNILIRGDSARANVKANVRFMRTGTARGLSTQTVTEDCASYGVWESSLESEVKARAEGK